MQQRSITATVIRLSVLALVLVLAGFAFSCSSDTSGTGTAPQFSAETQQQLEQAVQNGLHNHGYPISGVIVGIWAPDRGTWSKAFGMANATTGRAMQVTDGFRIGSITKTFTGTVILQLLQENRLSLDDTVSSFDIQVTNGDRITVRMLLNMTSGLYDYTNDDEFVQVFLDNPTRQWNPREFIDMANRHPALFEPGTAYKYCNTNYILLGMIIEKVTGNTYQSEIANRITIPLGLHHTYFPSGAELDESFCRGYCYLSADNIVDGTTLDPSFAGSAGGMVSNLEDMQKWAWALGSGTLLNQETQQQCLTWCGFPNPEDHYVKYCLAGWTYGEKFFGHTGVIKGYTDAAYYMSSHQATFVILYNGDYGDTDELFRALTKIVYPEEVPW